MAEKMKKLDRPRFLKPYYHSLGIHHPLRPLLPSLPKEPIPLSLGRMYLFCSNILHVATTQELGLHPAFNLGAKINDAGHMQGTQNTY